MTLSKPNHRILTRENIRSEYREIFNLVDRDGGGTITAEEMGILVDTLGVSSTPEEIQSLVSEMDQNQNGVIDFHGTYCEVKKAFQALESLAFSTQCKTDYSTAKQTNVTEKPQNCSSKIPSSIGQIHIDTILKALTNYGTNILGEEEALGLLSQMEPDNHGFVHYLEYVDVMMNSY